MSFRSAGAPPAATSKYHIKKEDILKIKSLIESIELDPNSEAFLEPVAWQGKPFLHIIRD